MAKYPPILESSVPAFILMKQYIPVTITAQEFTNSAIQYYYEQGNDYVVSTEYQNGTPYYKCTYGQLTIPFVMNNAVSVAEISGFKLIIKTITQNKILGDITIELSQWDRDNNVLQIDLIASKTSSYELINYGQYYKIQLAYIDTEGVIGHYSSVATIKATHNPEVYIDNLQIDNLNTVTNVFTGIYITQDVTEKVYYYTFNVYDKYHNLYLSSGQLLHNSLQAEIIKQNNINYLKSADTWTLDKPLVMNEPYTIEYSVITINNLDVTSMQYSIIARDTIDVSFNISVTGKANNDNGYIEIILLDTSTEYVTGSFVLSRACSKNQYGTWEKLLDFKLKKQAPFTHSWKDLAIEHGYSYIYSLQQVNEYNLYSNRIMSAPTQAAFEDSFLYDGEKQLKIRFNPKVSSFKNTILETKTDTIGSKYPFFFRNGNVSYKEFPISGLISYHSDNEELFMNKSNLFMNELDGNNYGVNLTSDNILAEQIFKMEVLKFLNSDKIKLFKSPSEGTYLVRLMNSSLSPNDTLGRMLHSFSTTAYEVKEYNYHNLINDKFLNFDVPVYDNKKCSIDFNQNRIVPGVNLIANVRAMALYLNGIEPGTIFDIILLNTANNTIQELSITIGPSGDYYLDNLENIFITSLTLRASTALTTGVLNYYILATDIEDKFNQMVNVAYSDVLIGQAFGPIDLAKQYDHFIDDNYKKKWLFNNLKQQPLVFSYIKLSRRQDPIETYYSNGSYFNLYTNEEIYNTNDLTINYSDKSALYRVNKTSYRDGSPSEAHLISGIDNYTAIINGVKIDVSKDNYELYPQEAIYQLELGSGVACDYVFTQSEIQYNYDIEHPADWAAVQSMYQKWQNDLMLYGTSNLEQLYIQAYADYLTRLKRSLRG